MFGGWLDTWVQTGAVQQDFEILEMSKRVDTPSVLKWLRKEFFTLFHFHSFNWPPGLAATVLESAGLEPGSQGRPLGPRVRELPVEKTSAKCSECGELQAEDTVWKTPVSKEEVAEDRHWETVGRAGAERWVVIAGRLPAALMGDGGP